VVWGDPDIGDLIFASIVAAKKPIPKDPPKNFVKTFWS